MVTTWLPNLPTDTTLHPTTYGRICDFKNLCNEGSDIHIGR